MREQIRVVTRLTMSIHLVDFISLGEAATRRRAARCSLLSLCPPFDEPLVDLPVAIRVDPEGTNILREASCDRNP
jgi:hypothetical protein